MDLIQNILLAILPPLYIVYYIYKNDLYEKESHRHLIISLVLGSLVTIPVIFIELATTVVFSNNVFLFAMIGIALVEEGSKLLILKYFCFPKKEFNEPYDGIMYAVVISMGFALVENLFYVLGNSENGMTIGILRLFTAIPLHATCGVIMGYYMGIAKMDSKKALQSILLAIALPVLIHGLYDYFLLEEFEGFGVVYSLMIVIAAIVYSNKAVRLHQSNSPFKFKN